jgi:hypothetical protein
MKSASRTAIDYNGIEARKLWPGQGAIGRTLRLGTDGHFRQPGELAPDGPPWQVVGIARDTRGVTLDGSDSEQVYLQIPADRLSDYPILVRVEAAVAIPLSTSPTCSTGQRVWPSDGPMCSDHRQPG